MSSLSLSLHKPHTKPNPYIRGLWGLVYKRAMTRRPDAVLRTLCFILLFQSAWIISKDDEWIENPPQRNRSSFFLIKKIRGCRTKTSIFIFFFKNVNKGLYSDETQKCFVWVTAGLSHNGFSIYNSWIPGRIVIFVFLSSAPLPFCVVNLLVKCPGTMYITLVVLFNHPVLFSFFCFCGVIWLYSSPS